MMSVSSGWGVGVVGTQSRCIRTRCRCRQDMVSESPGRGIGIIGMWCWCPREVVSVSLGCGTDVFGTQCRGRGHSRAAVRLAFQQYLRGRQDVIRSAEVRDSERMGNIRKQGDRGGQYCLPPGKARQEGVYVESGERETCTLEAE